MKSWRRLKTAKKRTLLELDLANYFRHKLQPSVYRWGTILKSLIDGKYVTQIRVMVKNQLKACVQYLKPVIDDHNLFSTSSDIKRRGSWGWRQSKGRARGVWWFPRKCHITDRSGCRAVSLSSPRYECMFKKEINEVSISFLNIHFCLPVVISCRVILFRCDR